MKKTFFLFMLFVASSILLSQNKKILVTFTDDITNTNSTLRPIGNLAFLDARSEKEIGKISEKGETQEIVIEDAEQRFPKWYKIWNSTSRGNDEMVFVLSKLKVNTSVNEEGKNLAQIYFYGATFLKKEDGYHFISKKDSTYSFASKKNISNITALAIAGITTDLLRKSFSKKVRSSFLNLEEMKAFDEVIRRNNISLNSELKDGIYRSYEDFYFQKPSENAALERNKNGEVTRAIDTSKKTKTFNGIPIFGYVEKGVPYFEYLNGFLPMYKNEKGFYVKASRNQLLPQNDDYYRMNGALVALAGAIAKDIRDKKFNRNAIVDVNIDQFTGEYDFPDQ